MGELGLCCQLCRLLQGDNESTVSLEMNTTELSQSILESYLLNIPTYSSKWLYVASFVLKWRLLAGNTTHIIAAYEKIMRALPKTLFDHEFILKYALGKAYMVVGRLQESLECVESCL